MEQLLFYHEGLLAATGSLIPSLALSAFPGIFRVPGVTGWTLGGGGDHVQAEKQQHPSYSVLKVIFISPGPLEALGSPKSLDLGGNKHFSIAYMSHSQRW